MPQQTERIQIELSYQGADVDDGAMSVEDIVPVLQGFSSAFGKLAASRDPNSRHKIRLTGIRKGSATLLLDAWQTLGDLSPQLQALGVIGGGSLFVITTIFNVVRLRKHVKRAPYTERISAAGHSIVVSNSQNVTIEVPPETFNVFKSGLLDSDLSKVTQPLIHGKVDAADIIAKLDGHTEHERITADERPFFETEGTTVTTTKETWLTGQFNSLTKSTLAGWFILTDGTRVFYEYRGDDAARFPATFARRGLVRVRCVAHMDENLKVSKLDIYQVQPLQGDLFGDLSDGDGTSSPSAKPHVGKKVQPAKSRRQRRGEVL